jgi:SAM-dependent methyltransferase
MLRSRDFALRVARCPFCGPTIVVRLRDEELGVRCVRCGASPVHWAIGIALSKHVPNLKFAEACELSSRGPLTMYLKSHARCVALSEFFPDVSPGTEHNRVRCEDVQRLSYPNESFDVVTHTEVLEHVPDDANAFAEMRRVLRPNGTLLFTVPLSGAATLERARLRDGAIEHLRPPVYHHDPLKSESILAFRDYGRDIVERLLAAGFAEAWIGEPTTRLFGFGRAVIGARR